MPYLDHAGAALPSEQQLREVYELALSIPMANPHSHHSTAAATHLMVENARLRNHSHFMVLEHFDVTPEEYAVVFTANATHALQMVAESFIFERKTSSSVQIGSIDNGTGWSVCLDAASFVSTSSLSLAEYRPHFVALSFYKMFGYPTGVGALLIRKVSDAVERLKPRAFAGGTVSQILVDELHSVTRKKIEGRFEYGTLNYYAICALTKGFKDLKRYGNQEGKECRDRKDVINGRPTGAIDEPISELTLSNADDPTSLVKLPLLTTEKSFESGFVCVNNVQTSECTTEASKWLTSFLGLPECTLRRVKQDSSRSLSNEAPYLVINEASIKILADAVGLTIEETIDRFRPNIVVKGLPPFIEDTAKRMSIDEFQFEVIKKCTRCEMICVNPNSGTKEPQLIVALRNFRQRKKVLPFSMQMYKQLRFPL
ncbi:unnamed protein product [Strongylus vulgaris]|uniref:MOSC domain-containing protein n=1 Tax=Strongylus vulgaris TaxID=40348 RepID=A0A3P7L5T1_STRVU|nr:unnamed protein product [Strongylus vulgaris]